MNKYMKKETGKEMFFKCLDDYIQLGHKLCDELNISTETVFFACANWLYVILVTRESSGNGANLKAELSLMLKTYLDKLDVSQDDIKEEMEKSKKEEINHE